MSTLLIAVTAMFIFYCASESFGVIARHAGAISGNFPLGMMLSNQVYSINRLNGFLIAPLLGLYVDQAGGEEALKMCALVACVGSALLLILVLRMWSKILVLFVRILEEVRESGFSVRTIKRLVSGKLDFVSTSKRSYSDWAMLVVQGLSTAIAMPAVFVLNILAIRHPEFKASLVQSATMISGLGNLLLNFYIFPRMALEETRGSADPIYYSAMLGKIGGIGIVAPIVIMFL